MLEEYRAHTKERWQLGIPPLPLNAEQVAGLVELIEQPVGHAIEQDKRLAGVYFQAIATPFFTCIGDDWYDNEEFGFLWPRDYQKVEKVIDEIIRLKCDEHFIVHNHAKQLELFKRYFANPKQRVRQAGCYLGDYVINVDQEGNINLCCFGKPAGNIRRDNIRTLWFSEDVQRVQRDMHVCDKNCHNMVNCFFKEDEELV